jgi:hypothetical protein
VELLRPEPLARSRPSPTAPRLEPVCAKPGHHLAISIPEDRRTCLDYVIFGSSRPGHRHFHVGRVWAGPWRASRAAARLIASGALHVSQLFDRPVGLVYGSVDASSRARV